MELPVYVYLIAFAVIAVSLVWAFRRKANEKKNKK